MIPPRTILFVHSSDELYGSDVVLLELVRRLDPLRFRPIVVTPTDVAYEGKLSKALAESGIEHRKIDMPVLRRRYLTPVGFPSFLRRIYSGTRALSQIIQQERVVLVHSNTSAVWGGALAAKKENLPHVWHIHEIITAPKLIRKLIAFMANRFSDHVIAISQAVAQHLLADQPNLKERCSVIYDAVDTKKFSPTIDGSALRKTWGMGAEDVVVGVVGRISAWKGQSFFLDAFQQAAEQSPHLRAVIVGDVVQGEDWRLTELKQQAERLGISDRIIWAGYLDNAPAVMSAIDILALPSTSPEPFGMVVIEAMAAARPVVASNHGGPRETLVAGETGFLVSPNTPGEMAAQLALLGNDSQLRNRLGVASRKHCIDTFSFKQQLNAIHKLYEKFLN